MGDADGLDIDTVQAAVDNAPGARIAIGTTANEVEGSRLQPPQALTQRTLVTRLRSTQRAPSLPADERSQPNQMLQAEFITVRPETSLPAQIYKRPC